MAFVELNGFVNTLKNFIKKEVRKVNGLDIYQVTGIGDLEELEQVKTGADVSRHLLQIQHLNLKSLSYNDVPFIGLGLGHFKGVIKYPSVGDVVLVGFLNGQKESPVVLGTLQDTFSQSQDKIPEVKLDEFFVTNKKFGTIFYIKNDNSVVLKTADANGNFKSSITINPAGLVSLTSTSGSVLTLKVDGSYELFNDAGIGLEVDTSDNVILSSFAVSIDDAAKLRLNADGSWKLFGKGNYGIEIDDAGEITIRDSSGAVSTTASAGTWP